MAAWSVVAGAELHLHPTVNGNKAPNISGRCETFASLPHCVPKPLVAKLVDHARAGRQAGIDKLVDLGRGREWLST